MHLGDVSIVGASLADRGLTLSMCNLIERKANSFLMQRPPYQTPPLRRYMIIFLPENLPFRQPSKSEGPNAPLRVTWIDPSS